MILDDVKSSLTQGKKARMIKSEKKLYITVNYTLDSSQ